MKTTCPNCRSWVCPWTKGRQPPADLDIVYGEGGAVVAGVCRRCWSRFEWVPAEQRAIESSMGQYDGDWSEVRVLPKERVPEPEKLKTPNCSCETLDEVRDGKRRVIAKVCRTCHRRQRRAECIVCEKVMFLREDDRTRKPICGGKCRKEHSAQLRRNLAEQKAKGAP